MRYPVLACDFDGTIATDGNVCDETLAALRRLRDSGRKIVLVTGREMEDLLKIFPAIEVFDRVVAENGGVLYRPTSHEYPALGQPPSAAFLQALRVVKVGACALSPPTVAPWQPSGGALAAPTGVRAGELGVTFKKGAGLGPPSPLKKATGLGGGLLELGLSPHNCVGVGDAENDHA